MTQKRVVHFLGEISGLAEEVLSRLMLNNTRCTIIDQHYDSSVEKISASLEFIQHKPKVHSLSNVSKDDVLLFFHFGNLEVDASILDIYHCNIIVISESPQQLHQPEHSIKLLHVHDMIHYLGDKHHNTKLDALLKLCQVNEPVVAENQPEKHWWVSQQDVAACLIKLIDNVDKLPPIMNICGRRGWTTQETLEQLQLLYQRTLAGVSGRFDANDLVAKPLITPILQSGKMSTKSLRPDLSVIDDVLQAVDGRRWRPLIPLRTSLMHYLATKDLDYKV
ncbi:hypothetical protein OA314_00965 [bacterium]|nr:hypothetical protein [bacterium]